MEMLSEFELDALLAEEFLVTWINFKLNKTTLTTSMTQRQKTLMTLKVYISTYRGLCKMHYTCTQPWWCKPENSYTILKNFAWAQKKLLKFMIASEKKFPQYPILVRHCCKLIRLHMKLILMQHLVSIHHPYLVPDCSTGNRRASALDGSEPIWKISDQWSTQILLSQATERIQKEIENHSVQKEHA